MRLLDRYLLRELLVPLGYCLSGFLLIWISADLFNSLQDFQSKKLGVADLVQYYGVVTPGFFITVFPIALLLALLYTLTNHARNHEITAIRAAGISMWRLCLPYLLVGLTGTLLLYAINEFWAPDSEERAEQILNHYKAQPKTGIDSTHQVQLLAFTNARDRRHWVIGLYDLRTAHMFNPSVLWQETNGSWRRLEAREAQWNPPGWVFQQAREYLISSQGNALPDLLVETNLLVMPNFTESPEEIRSEIRINNQLSAAGRLRKVELPVHSILSYLRLHPHPEASIRSKLFTQLQGRLAGPWTCVVVVLIAVPFGAASGRRNVFFGVAGSIAICFSYFVTQQIGLALGSNGMIYPWLGAWLPNLSFGAVGLWLTARVR